MTVRSVTDATFATEVLESKKPVLVDFWAPWCAPCRAVAPIIEQIATETRDVLDVVKLDTDENPSTAGRYGITGLPTLGVFVDGELATTIVGARPKIALRLLLRPYLQQTRSGTP